MGGLSEKLKRKTPTSYIWKILAKGEDLDRNSQSEKLCRWISSPSLVKTKRKKIDYSPRKQVTMNPAKTINEIGWQH